LERNRAMNEMNGVYCSSRPMRISAATPKKALGPAQQHYSNAIASSYHTTPTYSGAITPPHATLNDNDPNNTTIFVGGLDPAVGDEELKAVFGQFGELVYVKIPVGKGCGFVQFTHR
jgi:RNA recognition motif-containing protein